MMAKKGYEVKTQGKNKVGRPRRRWEEQLRRVTEMRRLPRCEVKTLAQDKNTWKKQITETSFYVTVINCKKNGNCRVQHLMESQFKHFVQTCRRQRENSYVGNQQRTWYLRRRMDYCY